jgi:hypothetical protein
MSPPPGIERDILEYLHLEFGEDKDDPDALQAADLKYVGAREDGDSLLHFWEYPSGSGKSWATARMTHDGYHLSTSLEGPSGEKNDPLTALRPMVVEFGTRKKGQKRIEPLRLDVSKLNENGFPVKFHTGEEIFFYAEVYPGSGEKPPDVSVHLLQHGDILFAVRCASGVQIILQLAGYDCLIRLGASPWET